MGVIAIMLVGVLLGNKLLPHKCKSLIEKIQFFCVVVLIFIMGVSIGSTEGVFYDLLNIGLTSTVYAIVPIIFSVFFVYALTKKAFFNKGEKK